MSRKERAPDELRPVEFQRGFTRNAAGSVLIRCGHTHVLCTASISAGVPVWREASGLGWVTAEYDMLPSATNTRRPRNRGQIDGRTQEIQRLIGRALRSVVDFAALGSNTIQLDCDVLQADGGTRTASITGAYVALCDAVAAGQRAGQWGAGVLTGGVAAVSVGVVEGAVCLDLDYAEDVAAEVDGNFALTTAGQWVEVQMTGERATLSDAQLQEMLRLGRAGIERLFAAQRSALAQP